MAHALYTHRLACGYLRADKAACAGVSLVRKIVSTGRSPLGFRAFRQGVERRDNRDKVAAHAIIYQRQLVPQVRSPSVGKYGRQRLETCCSTCFAYIDSLRVQSALSPAECRSKG